MLATGRNGTSPPGRPKWPAIDDLVNAAMLGAIAVILVAQVFSRYVLNYSLGWTSELSGILLGWLMFFGAPAMLKRQSHMAIFLFGALPPRPQRAIRILVELACAAFYLIVLIGSIDLVAASGMFTTPALGLRGDWVAAAVPLGSAYLVVRTLIRIADLRRSARPPWLRDGE